MNHLPFEELGLNIHYRRKVTREDPLDDEVEMKAEEEKCKEEKWIKGKGQQQQLRQTKNNSNENY